ncbi:MAG TPA: C2H2-type zinc finger protein [Phycisphaerae bacterium]|nr:C2H2-type zinc finger protein [Phycisphaerae bacterium]
MAKRGIKCPKCGRAFSMAAHLGRHLSTIHAAQSGRKTARTKAGGRKTPGPAGRTPAGGTGALLRQLQSHQTGLSAQQAALETEIAAVDQAIQAMSGTGAAPPARRSRKGGGSKGVRTGSLTDFVGRVLRRKKRPMTPAEVVQGVKTAGYKTSAKSLPNMVANTLAKMPGVKKVRRGLYQA